MAKARNYHVYGTVEFVNRLKDEYEFLGRYVRIEEPGHLIVLAYPPQKDKKIDPRREDRKSSEVRTRAPRGDRD